MYKIALINMPFSSLTLPSIALTQIKSVLQSRLKDQVSVEVVYVSHDYGKYLGLEFYDFLTDAPGSLNTGLGDWFFRPVAFPELPDNTEKYFERYWPARTPNVQQLKDWIAQKRPGLDAFTGEMITKYQLDQMDLVGLTSMFMQNNASFGMARKLKERNPNIITVMGGANCEYPMGTVIAQQVKDIDYVFAGPALAGFPEFVQNLINSEREKCDSIRGVFAKGSSVVKSGRDILGDELSIDTQVDLDYEPFLSRMESYFTKQEVQPALTFETSRGCWWGERAHCTFCGLNGATMAYRSMKPELAIGLLNSLFQFSGRVVRLSGVDNILPKNYLREVLPFLDTPLDMEMFYEVKADLSEEDMAVLARSGVTFIQPGIESFATSTLKLMKKGTTSFQNLKLLKMCAVHSITPYWNLLVGFPGEGEEVYKRYVEILPRMFHLPPPQGAFPVRFDRFSPYYDLAEQYKLDLYPLDFYSFVYPFNEADMKTFAYYFADKNIRAQYFMSMAKWIDKIRVIIAQWHARWDASKHSLLPDLYFVENSTVVYDSRSGSVVKHSVGETGKALLDFLAKPTRREDLPKAFPDLSADDLSRQIQLLEAKTLVYHEGDRMASLILSGPRGSRAREHLIRMQPHPLPFQAAAPLQPKAPPDLVILR